MADSIYDLYEDNPDTYLSAVNSVLSAIGQAPVSVVDQNNPEVMMILQIVKEVNKDVQSEGWIFNQEYRLPWRPDEDGYIEIPDDVLRLDVSDGQYIKSTDVIRRPGAKPNIDLPELKPKVKKLIERWISRRPEPGNYMSWPDTPECTKPAYGTCDDPGPDSNDQFNWQVNPSDVVVNTCKKDTFKLPFKTGSCDTNMEPCGTDPSNLRYRPYYQKADGSWIKGMEVGGSGDGHKVPDELESPGEYNCVALAQCNNSHREDKFREKKCCGESCIKSKPWKLILKAPDECGEDTGTPEPTPDPEPTPEPEKPTPILSDCEADPLCPYSTITFVWDSKSFIYGAFYDKQKVEFISFPGLGDRSSQRVWVKLRPDACDPDSFCGGLCIGEGKNAAGCTVTEVTQYTCEEIADRLFELKFEGDWVCEDAREDNLDED